MKSNQDSSAIEIDTTKVGDAVFAGERDLSAESRGTLGKSAERRAHQ